MNKAFVLYHFFEYGEDDFYEETKNLGVYSSKEKAEEAIDRYIRLPGFDQYTRDEFYICETTIDYGREWEEGFIKVEDA